MALKCYSTKLSKLTSLMGADGQCMSVDMISWGGQNGHLGDIPAENAGLQSYHMGRWGKHNMRNKLFHKG